MFSDISWLPPASRGRPSTIGTSRFASLCVYWLVSVWVWERDRWLVQQSRLSAPYWGRQLPRDNSHMWLRWSSLASSAAVAISRTAVINACEPATSTPEVLVSWPVPSLCCRVPGHSPLVLTHLVRTLTELSYLEKADVIEQLRI